VRTFSVAVQGARRDEQVAQQGMAAASIAGAPVVRQQSVAPAVGLRG